jgi:hypothetical protein
LAHIARVLFEAGLDGPLVAAALAERDVTLGWEKYTHRRDAQLQYQALVELVARSPRTRWSA